MTEKSFQCLRCGNCCRWPGYVRVNEEECAAIAAYLGMPVLEFTARYTILTSDRRMLSLIENAAGECIFYDNDPPGCRIDPVKPTQCREFPLYWNFPGWEKECAAGRAMQQKQED